MMTDAESADRAVPPLVVDTRPIFSRQGTPCGAIDDAVRRLEPGQRLVLLVPFEPVPLYAKLGSLGFQYEAAALPDGTWRAEFRRTAGDPGTPIEIPRCACDGDV